ncbi:MAG: alpha/beta hydrolase [Acidobacteria bacterium]|nr:alpha/beta hydrolase [Acidobacteriota bacterium]
MTPKVVKARNRNRLLVDLHAGGWMGGGESSALGAIILAGLNGIRAIAVDFRVLPDHPFPAAMDDSTAVWKDVVKHTKPGNIAVTGSSAGGAMVFSLVQRAKREGLPLPAAVVSDSPFADLSKTGDSYHTNEWVDNRIHGYEGFLQALARLYANGRDLKDPLISPVYGDFAGFPPTFLVSGTRDLFLSNAVRVQGKLLEAGVPTQLVVAEAFTHGIIQEAVMRDVPEGFAIYSYIARFLDTHLGR